MLYTAAVVVTMVDIGTPEAVTTIIEIVYVPEGRDSMGRKARALAPAESVMELEIICTVAPEELFTTPRTIAVVATPPVFT